MIQSGVLSFLGIIHLNDYYETARQHQLKSFLLPHFQFSNCNPPSVRASLDGWGGRGIVDTSKVSCRAIHICVNGSWLVLWALYFSLRDADVSF